MQGRRFLPPEPGGPEPDLGERRRPAPPPPSPPPLAPAGPAPAAGPAQGHPRPGDPLGWGQPGHAASGPPANGIAITGFVFSVLAATTIVLSVGLLSILSVAAAITGIVCSRAGRERVDRGQTPLHRDLAQAGFVIGIVALVVSVLATVAWIVLIFTAGSIFDDGGDGGGGGSPPQVQAAAAAARALAALAA